MIRSLPHLTNLPGAIQLMCGGGKAYLRPSSYLLFKASLPDAPLSKRSRLKILGYLVGPTACKEVHYWGFPVLEHPVA